MTTPEEKINHNDQSVPTPQRGKTAIFVDRCVTTIIVSIITSVMLCVLLYEIFTYNLSMTPFFFIMIFISSFYIFFKRIKIIDENGTGIDDDSLDYVGNFNHPRNPFATTTPSSARYIDTQSQNAHFQQDSQRSSDYYNHYHNR